MKQTVFNAIHRKSGGKMVEFAGFDMPVEFKGIKEEHMTVRERVGVFDVSHMGEIWIRGPKAAALVQYLTTNDITILKQGQAQYSCFPNGKGGIVDDLLVYYIAPEEYLLVVNASNIEKDYNWICDNNKFRAEVTNASDTTSQLAIQGPKALAVLQKLTSIDLSCIGYYTFVIGTIAGIENVIISATGYTGAGGFELYFSNEVGIHIYDAIFEAGREFDIQPIGLGARDTLRLEMGYCLYGNDIDDTTSPIEAGLGWITKFGANNDFIDKERLQTQKSDGVSRILKGFEMEERGIPRHGYELTDESGSVIGVVTSGTHSPVLNSGIGLAYVNKNYSLTGTDIWVRIRNKLIKAKIVKTPFIKK